MGRTLWVCGKIKIIEDGLQAKPRILLDSVQVMTLFIVCTYICCMYVCTPLRTQAPCRFGFPPPCLLPYSCATRKAIAVWQIYRRSAAHCFFIFSLTCTARDLGRQVKLGSSSVATVFVEKLQRQLIRLVRSQRVVGTTHPVERIAIVSSKSFPR